mgnify:CR=1 FL=1
MFWQIYKKCWDSVWSLLSGDNFFKSATYTIEAVSAESFKDSAEKLKAIEAQLLNKQKELREFEVEYKEVRCGLEYLHMAPL